MEKLETEFTGCYIYASMFEVIDTLSEAGRYESAYSYLRAIRELWQHGEIKTQVTEMDLKLCLKGDTKLIVKARSKRSSSTTATTAAEYTQQKGRNIRNSESGTSATDIIKDSDTRLNDCMTNRFLDILTEDKGGSSNQVVKSNEKIPDGELIEFYYSVGIESKFLNDGELSEFAIKNICNYREKNHCGFITDQNFDDYKKYAISCYNKTKQNLIEKGGNVAKSEPD